MGLIKAALNSVSSSLGDQFKEFITCPTIEKNVLIQKGTVNHGSGNSNPSEGIITNGSGIVVPQGMAMMIVDNGAVVEFTAEAGTYTYDKGSEPSIFTGGLGKGIIDTIKTIGKRITYGGQTAKDQRVYYVNILVITGNKFGSPQPKKITDEKYGMLEVTFFGEYAFQVIDPVLLVQNVIGANPKDTLTYEEIIGTQLKNKFVEQFTQAVSVVMRKHKVSFGDMGMYGGDISEEMNHVLDDSWKSKYGLVITDVAIGDINLTEASMQRVSKVDDAMIFSNPGLQSGLMASSTADAMKMAASNEAGAMMGFMGMNMASGTGATAMGAVNNNGGGAYTTNNNTPEPGTLFQKNETVNNNKTLNTNVNNEAQPSNSSNVDVPKFCSECGTPTNGGKFCANCGHKLV